MRAGLKVIIVIAFIFSLLSPTFVYPNMSNNGDGIISDTTKSKKELRKENRKLARKALKPKIFITGKAMYANLTSSVRFETESGLFSTQLELERHLGLEENMPLFSGSIIYRITPRSGLFSNYYGLNRTNNIKLEQDIVFLGDTLEKGTLLQGYFNTQVFGLGYLIAIVSDQKSFLGAYFNAYWISLKTGVHSEDLDYNDKVGFQAPLPNFGVVAMFELTKWLSLSGSLGIFFLNIDGFKGSFHDIYAAFSLKPIKWIGIDVGYQIFDVSANFPEESFRTIVKYNYRGPFVGFTLRF